MNVEQALKAADEGMAEGLRGQYPMAAQVLATEVRNLRGELRAVSDALGDPASDMFVPLADSIKEVKAAVRQLLNWMRATDLYQFGREYPKEAAVLERVFGKDIL